MCQTLRIIQEEDLVWQIKPIKNHILSTLDSKIAAKFKNKNSYKSKEIKIVRVDMNQIKITIIFNKFIMSIMDRIKLKVIKVVFKYKISMRKMEIQLVNLIKAIYMEINIKIINFQMYNKIRIILKILR